MTDYFEIFNERKNNPLWNTSYPLNPSDWNSYRCKEPLEFEDNGNLSFYIHIPFCRRLCAFCEYTRMLCPSNLVQLKYIDTIQSDVKDFVLKHRNVTIEGFDIGGGTPTVLCDEAFSKLMLIYSYVIENMKTVDNFTPSIEATFESLDINKIKEISKTGFKRVSFGLQSTDSVLLKDYNRQWHDTKEIKQKMNILHDNSISIINIDMMYGFVEQNFDMVERDLEIIADLMPENITLYELRTNMIHAAVKDKDYIWCIYNRYYEGLLKLGYIAKYGQNTFSLNNDMGVSSYLENRMLKGGYYKGFGISAQSMNSLGVAYNVGKNKTRFQEYLLLPTFFEEFTYKLPPKELLAKFISISAYSGAFSISNASRILGHNFKIMYSDIIKFCIDNSFLYYENDDQLRFTLKGFKYYGAIISLFHH